MKRPLIITIGILIILLILGLWVYLLLYGAPKGAGEVFTNLGVIPQGENVVTVVDANSNPSAQLALTGSELQQLTTRAVAGFTFASSSNSIVRYVERGTGHVFEIDLNSQVEKQISLSTVPLTTEAIFSPLGSTVVFTSYDGYEKVSTIGILTTNGTSMDLATLPRNAENLAFKNEGTLYFSLAENNETTGYSYDVAKLTQTELFTIPTPDTRLIWGNTFTELFAQSKPTQYQEGYLYRITNSLLTPILAPAYGLTTLIDNSNRFIATYITGDRFVSSLIENETRTEQSITMLPEKCVFDNDSNDNVWCGAPVTSVGVDYLENWYKGVVISEDYLWLTHLPTQTSTLIGDLPTLSGRTLDVTDLQINPYSSLLLFKNKIDQTLWLYKIGE